MNTVERNQTRTDCTMADLESWCADVDVHVGERDDAYRVTRIDRTYPRCIGCGSSVFDNPGGNALVIKAQGQAITSVTFWPCGCVFTVGGSL